MASIVIAGDTSGSVTLAAPAVAGTTTITLPATSGTLLQSGTTVTEAQGGTGTTTGYYGFKNRIINGAMVIDQRNAGASYTPVNGQYGIDRWSSLVSQSSKFTVQQNAASVTPPTGYTNYLGVTSSSAYAVTAGDYFTIQQKIEGYNTADLAWGSASASSVTLSFWIRSSLTGTFGGALSNSAQSATYPFSYTISSANTWEQKSIVIAGPTSGTWVTNSGVGVWVIFSLGTGTTYSGTAGVWGTTAYAVSSTGSSSVVGTSGATFYITGIQLEKGSTATSFDYRDYGRELMLCQRYYQQFGSSAYPRIRGYGLASTETMATFPFPSTMRAAPTGTLAGTWIATNCSAPAVGSTDTFGYETRTTVTSTAMFQYYCNGTTGFATFDAEL